MTTGRDSRVVPTWIKLVMPFVLGLLAAVAVWCILPMMWFGCDVEPPGVSQKISRGVVLLAVVAVVFLVTVVLTSMAFSSVMRTRWARSPYFVIGAAVAIAVLVVLVPVLVVNDPGSYGPNSKCPNGTRSPWSRMVH